MTYLEGLPDPPAERGGSSPSRGRTFGLLVASVAVVAGAVFAAVNLAGGEANEPTDPVRAIFDAAERGDAIGMLEQLEPGERDALRDPLVDLTKELNRLGVLEDASLSKVTGYELDIRDLELRSNELRDGVQSVRITGGRSTYTVDPSKLPLGPFTLGLAGGEPQAGATSTGSSELRSEGPDDEVVVVRRGDRWYVSLGYTVAEAARRSSGLASSDLGPGVEPEGADSPEDAVRGLFTAATGLDPRGVIALLPPGEMGAVQEYAGLFLDELELGARYARRSTSITMPTLELDADTDGSHALVTIKAVEVDVDVDGGRTSFAYRDGCVELQTPTEDPVRQCQGDDPDQAIRDLNRRRGDAVEVPPLPAFSFLDKRIETGFAATRVDGKWYVSPTRTVLDNLVIALRALEPGDLEKGRDWWRALQDSFESSFDESLRGSIDGWSDLPSGSDEPDDSSPAGPTTTAPATTAPGRAPVSAPPVY